MRDPARIPVVLEALRKAWEAYPDMRLGQLVSNALYFNADGNSSAGAPRDVFLVEDGPMRNGLEGIAKRAEEMKND